MSRPLSSCQEAGEFCHNVILWNKLNLAMVIFGVHKSIEKEKKNFMKSVRMNNTSNCRSQTTAIKFLCFCYKFLPQANQQHKMVSSEMRSHPPVAQCTNLGFLVRDLSTGRGRFILVKFKSIEPFDLCGILITTYALVLLQVPCKLSSSS